MAWINPTTPNLADYASFLASVVGIPPAAPPAPPGAAGVFPSATGSVSSGTTTSLTDGNQSWASGQWNGCTVYDSTLNESAVITATSQNEVTFAALTQAPTAGDAYIIVQPIAAVSLAIALRTVNQALNAIDAATYTLAVYNLAADRLINFAPDQPSQTFFRDLRAKFRLDQVSVGAVGNASDQGTSAAVLNPDWMKKMTLRDLQTLKTPYGRDYMAMVMDYGPNVWVRV